VLSCRVFGYGIENAVVNAIKHMARDETSGATRPIRGVYRETPHNELCRQLYPDNGFTWDIDSWLLREVQTPKDPSWLRITNRLPLRRLTASARTREQKHTLTAAGQTSSAPAEHDG
jgi:hypothetical protein